MSTTYVRLLAAAVLCSSSLTTVLGAPSGARTHAAPGVIPSIWKGLGDAIAGSQPLTFTFVLTPSNDAGLEARMLEIANSKGTQNWLSDDELTSFIKPTDETANAVNAAIQTLGGTNVQRSKSGDQVTLTTTVGKASNFFSASFKKYQYDNSADQTVIRTQSYTIPASLAAHVSDVFPIATFGNFRRQTYVADDSVNLAERGFATLEKRAFPGCSTAQVNSSCIRKLYGFDTYQPTTSTGNPRLGIMAYIGQNFSPGDLKTYLSKFRPQASSYNIPVETSNGAINIPILPGVEAALDTQTAAGIIYPLPSKFYDIGNQLTQGDIFLLTFNKFISGAASNRPPVITISYGSLESDFTAAQAQTMCNAAKQLSALGTTIVVSSGDTGVAGQSGSTCPPFVPTYPGGCPYILSVGATQNFGPEVMVDSSLAGFYSGAGFSNYFPTPSYQQAVVSAYISKLNGKDAAYYNASGRAFPDVSAQGSRQAVVVSGQTELVGGTSASAPIFASGITLLNDLLSKAGKGSVGWANPTFYANGNQFTDVTSGGSYACPGDGGDGFPAAQGWDASAGLGTPILAKLRSIYGV